MILVHSVKVLDKFNVQLGFNDNTEKIINLEPLLRGPIFEPIRSNPEIFRLIQVDEELGTIIWPNGADIDPDVLYGTHLPAWMEESEVFVITA